MAENSDSRERAGWAAVGPMLPTEDRSVHPQQQVLAWCGCGWFRTAVGTAAADSLVRAHLDEGCGEGDGDG